MSVFFGVLALFFLQIASAAAQSTWLTLDGDPPEIIAKGGFSGLFPDSSSNAYEFALMTSSADVILFCNVQLTKDGWGICASGLELGNTTNIADIFPNRERTYQVNGVSVDGWFPVDFTLNELVNVSLIQSVPSRTTAFDGYYFPLLTVEDLVEQLNSSNLWLNFENDLFFQRHNLSMSSFVRSITRRVPVKYISSSNLDFLRSIAPRFRSSNTTKLLFRFLGGQNIEPSTNQSYRSLLEDISAFNWTSGIVVPKTAIWPVDRNMYLQRHTSVVADAHREGLLVFASGFANDIPFAYNYSYDAVAEILSFVDNGNFSVDGLLSDFPITPSEAIGCFSHLNQSSEKPASPVIISNKGYSGMYPPCSDIACEKAVEAGADVVDCAVQMTKDGISACLNSIDLLSGTDILAHQSLYTRISKHPEIQQTDGVFAFNLTWNEIQTLRPSMVNPLIDYRLYRNPALDNSGNFLSLPAFLEFASNQSISGVLLSIEDAPYLASQVGLDVIGAVLRAINNSPYAQRKQEIIIQSTDSSVLKAFKQEGNYSLMYMVDEGIRDAQNSSIEDIKKFADLIAISKQSIFPVNAAFLRGNTDLVPKLQTFGLKVFVFLLRNEFVTQPWDFLSDAVVEINSFVQGVGVDGIITDFPDTASKYKINSCLKDKTPPSYMQPIQAGTLLPLVTPNSLPPAPAPFPVLTDADVSEPPISPVLRKNTPAPAPSILQTPPSGQFRLAASALVPLLLNLAVLLFHIFC